LKGVDHNETQVSENLECEQECQITESQFPGICWVEGIDEIQEPENEEEGNWEWSQEDILKARREEGGDCVPGQVGILKELIFDNVK